MNNDELLEITTEIGWRLLQSGAEIYRVEESIRRMLEAYGFPEAEVFSIPSCIIVTINDETGHALTRLKRNRSAGLDFDRIDQLNNLCRHICAETPELPVIQQKLAAIMNKKDYSFWTNMFFTASISASFTLFYGGFSLTALLPSSSASFCSYYCPFWETFIPTAFSRTSLAVRWWQGFRCGRRQWAGPSAMTR